MNCRRIAVPVWLGLTAAAFMAALGARIGWTKAPELPTRPQISSIMTVAFPGAPWEEVTRTEFLAGSEHPLPGAILFGDDEYGPGAVEIEIHSPVTDLAPVARRLEFAGWRAGATDGGWLTAAHDDWRLTVYPTYEINSPLVEVERAEPGQAQVLSVAFWLAGGLLVGAAARRSDRRLGVPGVVGLTLLIPHTVIVAILLLADIAEIFGTGSFTLLWEPLMGSLVRLPTVIGLAALAVGIVRAAAERLRRTPAAAPESAPPAPPPAAGSR